MLYLVATPIGNLGDITLRALEVLKSADEIACEDTRRSLVLLNHYGIKKPLISYHKFNERQAGEKILEKLAEGKNIALITDAGMPAISDPGALLVEKLIESGEKYTVVPGASALTSALALSGLTGTRFAFLGFLPEGRSERQTLFESYKKIKTIIAFYSAPHDVERDISSAYLSLGDMRAVAVKEITKLHETVTYFNLKEGLKDPPRGEYVILIDNTGEQNELCSLSEKEHIKYYMDAGLDKKEALKRAAKDRGVSKSALYKFAVDLKDAERDEL